MCRNIFFYFCNEVIAIFYFTQFFKLCFSPTYFHFKYLLFELLLTVFMVSARYSKGPLFRKSIVHKCATVLTFRLRLGLGSVLALRVKLKVSGNSRLSE